MSRPDRLGAAEHFLNDVDRRQGVKRSSSDGIKSYRSTYVTGPWSIMGLPFDFIGEGHDYYVDLSLSAQCVCHILSVRPAVSIVQAEAAHTRR